MDTSVLLENKLRGTWSAPDFQQYLTAGRLEFASKEFATLEVGIKLRLLLSLLSLPAPQLASLRDGVQMVLRVAESDRDEWVRVVLAMVRRRLPSAQSLGWTSADENDGGAGAGSGDDGAGARRGDDGAGAGRGDDGGGVVAPAKTSDAGNGSNTKDTTNGTRSGALVDGNEPSSQQDLEPPLSQDSLASTDGSKGDPGGGGDGHIGLDGDNPELIDYFEYSLHEISKRLMGGSKSLVARTGADAATAEVLSPEFVPLEWPYLCKEVFPPGVEIEDVNRHFVPVNVGAGGKLGGGAGAGAGAADSMANSAEARAAAAAKESAEREARIAQAVSAAERKAKSKKRGVKMVNEEGSAAAGGTGAPAGGTGAPAGEAGAGANVPAAIQGILRDPKNNKLTDESRQAVLEFYEFEKEGRPAVGERLVPLSETQEYVDDNTAILATLVQLKLNYGDNTAKRVKSKKKYKLKEGAQPVVSPAPST